MRMNKIFKIAASLAVAIVSAKVVATSPEIEPRERRVEECGVESYKEQQSPICGVSKYRIARSPACGKPELYRQRQSKNCPGYQPARSYDISKTTSCGGSEPRNDLVCGDGETRSGYRSVSEGCWRSRARRSTRWKANATCNVPEIINSCRLAEFGVERYPACEHANHGVESYKSCRRSEFGVEMYRSCLVRATKDELQTKLATIRSNAPVFSLKLVHLQADYYAANNSDKAMACLIDRYEKDPLNEELVADLKTLFASTFNKKFESNTYDCKIEDDMDIQQCENGDSSNRCVAYRAYLSTKSWFTSQIEDLEALKDDLVAKQDETISGDINAVKVTLELNIKSAPKIIIKRLINLTDVLGLINKDEIERYNYTYTLIATRHDGTQASFKGKAVGDTVAFVIGEKIAEEFKSCKFEIHGKADGAITWKDDVPGLYYRSSDTEITKDGAGAMKLYRRFAE